MTVYSAVTFALALVISLLLYPPLIRALGRWKALYVIQKELPASHQKKAGTPSAGGTLFVAMGIVAGVLATIAGHSGALPAIAGLLAGGLIGFADDLSKLRVGARGIPARLKLPIQVALAVPVAWLATVQGVPHQLFLPAAPWLIFP